jgi:hypothetical protein
MSAAFYPQVQKIYVAYYGRPADPAGLQYWAGQLAANGGNLTSIINAFGNSAESTALYAGASDSAKVTAIYQQLFNRAPDAPGLAFYTTELTAGRMSAASIALNVANGATGTDATRLANKATVGTAFTDALTVDSAAAVAYSGTTAITAARSLITGTTDTAATTNVASTITSIKSSGGATGGQTFTLTTAMTLAAADALPDFYRIASGEVDGGNLSVEQYVDGSALAASVIAGATNASSVDVDVSYTITDTLANLVGADSEILEGAESYSLSTTAFTADPLNASVAGLAAAVAAAQGSYFSDDEQAIIDDAANGDDVEVSVAYSLTDTVANLAAASAAVLAGATSYSLSNAAGALGDLTQAQIDVIEGASNAASFTYGLAGSTYTLSADEDNLIGTSGNDTFNATSSTLTNDDKITDSSSTDRDVLNVTATGALGDELDITNVETINVNWQRLSNATIDLVNVSGATVNVSSTRSAFTGNVTFDATGSNAVAVGAGVDGALTVNAPEDTSITATVAQTITVATGDGSLTINAGAATDVTVGGTLDEVALTALSADDIALNGDWDEATLSLGVDADVTVNGASDAIVTINSNADIEVTIETGSEFESLNAVGSGVVDLVFESASDLSGLEIVTNGAVTLMTAESADFSLVEADEIVIGSMDTATFTMVDGQSIVLGSYNAAHDISFAVADDEDTSANNLVVTVTETSDRIYFNSASTSDFEQVTIVVDVASDYDVDVPVDFNQINYSATAGQDLTFISTDEDVDINIDAIYAASIDASGVAGRFEFEYGSGATGDVVVIGAAGGSSAEFANTTSDIEFTAETDEDNTIDLILTTGNGYINITGDGDNTINATGTLAAGSLDVTLGGGDDTLLLTGGTGDLTFDLGGGDDQVVFTGGVADFQVVGLLGSGDDRVFVESGALDSATVWSIDFGAGDDILYLTGGSTDWEEADITFTGLETIVVETAGMVRLDSNVLHGMDYELMVNGIASGAATGTIFIEIQTGTDEFDGSSLVIDGTIRNAFLGLNISVDNGDAATSIIGTDGNDTITGGAGDDTITGGAGVDALTGGVGIDTYVFVDGDSGVETGTQDTITQFSAGTDLIDFGVAGSLTNYEEYSAATITDYASAVTAANTEADADDGVIYLFITDLTNGWVFADYDDDGTVDLGVSLTGLATLNTFAASSLV